ncbi:hypothetical protein F4803DRAFT_539004 [Xylaria telfairii]|nr:hypothetical protein F4803DRAFT_539004 [Xylaria telfairii]
MLFRISVPLLLAPIVEACSLFLHIIVRLVIVKLYLQTKFFGGCSKITMLLTIVIIVRR